MPPDPRAVAAVWFVGLALAGGSAVYQWGWSAGALLVGIAFLQLATSQKR